MEAADLVEISVDSGVISDLRNRRYRQRRGMKPCSTISRWTTERYAWLSSVQLVDASDISDRRVCRPVAPMLTMPPPQSP